jgi:hypothetical protein
MEKTFRSDSVAFSLQSMNKQMIFFLGFQGPFRFLYPLLPTFLTNADVVSLGWPIPSCYLKSAELEDLL